MCKKGPAPPSHYKPEAAAGLLADVTAALAEEVNPESGRALEDKDIEFMLWRWIKDSAGRLGNGPGRGVRNGKKRKVANAAHEVERA
jgi:hypothetical protein